MKRLSNRSCKATNLIDMQDFIEKHATSISERRKDVLADFMWKKFIHLSRTNNINTKNASEIIDMISVVLTKGDVGEKAYLLAAIRKIYEIVINTRNGG